MKILQLVLIVTIVTSIGLSSVGLLVVYFSGYVSDVHLAKALPLAIVFGFSLLSGVLYSKR